MYPYHILQCNTEYRSLKRFIPFWEQILRIILIAHLLVVGFDRLDQSIQKLIVLFSQNGSLILSLISRELDSNLALRLFRPESFLQKSNLINHRCWLVISDPCWQPHFFRFHTASSDAVCLSIRCSRNRQSTIHWNDLQIICRKSSLRLLQRQVTSSWSHFQKVWTWEDGNLSRGDN